MINEFKQYRYAIKINKNSKGFTWNATVRGDNYQEIDDAIENIKILVEQKIKKWKNG